MQSKLNFGHYTNLILEYIFIKALKGNKFEISSIVKLKEKPLYPCNMINQINFMWKFIFYVLSDE